MVKSRVLTDDNGGELKEPNYTSLFEEVIIPSVNYNEEYEY